MSVRHPVLVPGPTRASRRASLLAASLAALIASAMSAGCSGDGPTSATIDGSLRDWNLLLVTLDTTRRDHLGCYGKSDARTPTLDSLAEGGVVFDRAVAQAPITLPSHASILTGLNPPSHGVRGNGVYALPDRHATLAEMLSDAGYATAGVVAAFVLDRRFGLDQGFDHYDDDPATMQDQGTNDPSRAGSVVTATALRLVDSMPDPDRPYFLWAHYFDPHHPYEPPARFAEPHPETRAGRYQGEIDAMDAAIGRLLDGLRERGKLERTLVVVVADHGEGITGPHAESTHGLLLYEDTLGIPLIVHADGAIAPGRRDAELTRQIDLVPTILELLEIERPAGVPFDGASFADRLREPLDPSAPEGTSPPAAQEPTYAYSESFLGWDSYGWSPIFQVSTTRWKYIEASRKELYDLASDPEEAHDVAATENARVEAMSAALSRLRGGDGFDAGAFAKSVITNRDDAARLRALGYVESADPAPAITDPSTLRHPADSLDLFDAIDETRFLQTEGQHDRALEKIDTVLAQDPRNYLALALRAESLQARRDYANAAETLRRLVELRPEEPSTLGRLGTVELRLAAAFEQSRSPVIAKRHEEAAMRAFERAVELGSLDVAPYLGLGRHEVARGKFPRAIELLEMARDLDDRLASVHYLLGFARGEDGDPAGALEALERAFALAANSPALRIEIQRTRATNRLRLEEPDRAIEHLQWILDRNPSPQVAGEVRTAIDRIRRVHR